MSEGCSTISEGSLQSKRGGGVVRVAPHHELLPRRVDRSILLAVRASGRRDIEVVVLRRLVKDPWVDRAS